MRASCLSSIGIRMGARKSHGPVEDSGPGRVDGLTGCPAGGTIPGVGLLVESPPLLVNDYCLYYC